MHEQIVASVDNKQEALGLDVVLDILLNELKIGL